jgi:hypothetical protein
VTSTENQSEVLQALKGFTGIEPLKRLFWSELNYERINYPISRSGWTDSPEQSGFTLVFALFAKETFSNWLGSCRIEESRNQANGLMLSPLSPVFAAELHIGKAIFTNPAVTDLFG